MSDDWIDFCLLYIPDQSWKTTSNAVKPSWQDESERTLNPSVPEIPPIHIFSVSISALPSVVKGFFIRQTADSFCCAPWLWTIRWTIHGALQFEVVPPSWKVFFVDANLCVTSVHHLALMHQCADFVQISCCLRKVGWYPPRWPTFQLLRESQISAQNWVSWISE